MYNILFVVMEAELQAQCHKKAILQQNKENWQSISASHHPAVDSQGERKKKTWSF